MLTINNLDIYYKDKHALSIKKELQFNKNERIGIIGSNGSGKSSLVNAIVGLVNYKGHIETQLKSSDIAIHMQSNEYVDTMKTKHILEYLLNTKIRANQELKDLIDYFDFNECLDKKFKNLSGGQKQRFTIIMVLMQNAKLTFFDEVSSGLDFETRQQLMGKIKQWYKDKDATVCAVSHYYEELDNFVNKLIIIEDGHIIDVGSPEDLFAKYCGHSIIIIENNEFNIQVTHSCKKILAPEHLIALACDSYDHEKEVMDLLNINRIQFKLSYKDIEIMYYNAKKGAAL